MSYEHPTFKDTYVGSGIIINHSHVLTAGHNLYSSKNGGIPDEVCFYPGRQGEYSPWSLKGKTFKIHPRYYNDEDYDYDLALLTLEESNVGLQTGWPRLRIFDDDKLLKGLNINITGYPLDKFVKDQPYMYTMSGSIKVAHKNRFYYEVDTSGGQSGSGVYVLDVNAGNMTDCCGIHTTGSKVEGNGATRINDEKFNIVGKWFTSS